jgi:transcriptional regulator with XRE-family HTH domain
MFHMTMGTATIQNVDRRHVRAARALLAWSQQDLAEAAGVATSTVADFERGQRTPIPANAQAMRAALEKASVRFLPNGAVTGPAIPFVATRKGTGAPIRWVDVQDLAQWADRIDGAHSLPTLVAHLVRATLETAVQLRFPSDEGVRQPGWDGSTFTAVAGDRYVPHGEARWEIGAQRSQIPQKASKDYAKRTAAETDPANLTFVFVTPRHWPGKVKWVKARQNEHVWRDVVAYDATDLVHWIEQSPATGLWLATRLNKRPPGTRELDSIWKEWSLATQWHLTEDLILSDRDEDAAEVLRWLRREPSVLSLQATTTEEVVAFFHATLGMLPAAVADAYRARCLVATTAEGARALSHAFAPLYILLTDPDPGLAHALVDRGHFVLLAYDERPISGGEIRSLARPSRDGIASALTAAGIAEARAEALARDSARNLAILRRLIPSAPGGVPDWAKQRPPQALLAALLAGGWDENMAADQARLEELADQPYAAAIAALTPYVGDLDRPLQKVGSTWRIASPRDAWMLLARHLTTADLTRFERAAHAVLGSTDPRFDLAPDQRWMAPVRGVVPAYSAMLRHGLGQVLILLAQWGKQVHTVPDAAGRADAIVGTLLDDADQRRWWSLSRDFRLLAEASPNAFLAAIEDSLDQAEPTLRALFATDDGGGFGAEHLSDLLWALESLAWSHDLLPRVTHVLARLDAMDNPPGRHTNRPSNSLVRIHLLWLPQTYATLDQRLRAIDLIRNQEREAAWKLMIGLLPSGHGVAMSSPMPRWRDFTVAEVEEVTKGLLERGAAAITKRLVADVGTNAARWSQLIERFAHLIPGPEVGVAALEIAEPTITDKNDRTELWTSLRRALHRYRRFPSAKLSPNVLERLAAIYERLAPADPLERTAWLFEHRAVLPDPPAEGWEADEPAVDAARRQAVQAIFAAGGVSAVLAIARLTDVASWVGLALYDKTLPVSALDEVIEAALRSDDARERNVADGLIRSCLYHRGEPWATSLLEKAMRGAWGDPAMLTILHALPTQRWTWDQAARAGAEIERGYWRQAPVYWMSEDVDDVVFAIRMLISVGRARHALPLAMPGSKVSLPSALLVGVLQAAAQQPVKDDGDPNAPTMFQYHVAEILGILDTRGDVASTTMVALEWLYLPILEHSQRPPEALPRALSEDPSLFLQMLKAVFKPSDDSGVVEAEPEDREKASAIATRAFQLLHQWDRLPGTREDGSIDAGALEAWIKQARSLAKQAGRAGIADDQIGSMLSASPMGADGHWPAEAVREALDRFRSKPMLEGFYIGKRNRLGATMRAVSGELDRQEAAQYRTWAKAIAFEHPRTAKALETLADGYERDARRHDEATERDDWR